MFSVGIRLLKQPDIQEKYSFNERESYGTFLHKESLATSHISSPDVNELKEVSPAPTLGVGTWFSERGKFERLGGLEVRSGHVDERGER